MKYETYQYFLFVSAALFNWVVGLSLLFAYRPFLGLVAPQNIPEHPIYLHLFAIIIVVFGIGYYWARHDLQRYREVVKIGAIAKIPVFLVPLFYWYEGSVDWHLVTLAMVDLCYAVLFIYILIEPPQQPAN